MTIHRLLIAATCGTALVGLMGACAPPTEPQRLVEARAAYSSASSGGAAQFAPVELDNARVALTSAEQAYQRHPRSSSVVDLSYVAQRRAEEAQATATTRIAERQRADALAAAARTEAQRARETSAQLSATREQLAAEQARAEAAEQRANLARENLRQVAAVREDMRGLVITLSGQVLFPTGQSVLLPSAQSKLQLVARTLREMPDRTIEVDGHTDALGDANTNYALSLARAQAVREFLVANGVESERIRSVGFGSSRPTADNTTPIGRAENRRVEIVLQPMPGRPSMGGGP